MSNSRLFMLLIALITALAGLVPVVGAQDPMPPPDSLFDGLEPITAENAESVIELARWGNGTISKVAWSPDGDLLAAAGSLGVWLYDAHNLHAPPRLLEGHTERVLDIAFSPDGSLIASGSADRTARVWATATATPRFVLTGHEDWVFAVAFSPDGSTLATGGDYYKVRLWDVATGAEAAALDYFCAPSPDALAFSPDGSELACGSSPGLFADYAGGGTRLWDFASQSETQDWFWPHHSVTYSPDGKWLIMGREVYPPDYVHQVALRSTESGEIVEELFPADAGLSFSAVHQVSVNAGSDLIAAAEDHGLRVYDLGARLTESQTELERLLPGHPVGSVAFHPTNADRLAYVSENVLYVHDLATGIQQHVQHSSAITQLAINPDGSQVAVAHENGTVDLWPTGLDPRPIRLRPRDDMPINTLAFSPDGRILAVGTLGETLLNRPFQRDKQTGAIELWDLQSNQLLTRRITLSSYRQSSAFAFSPTGSQLVYNCAPKPYGDFVLNSTDYALWLWDVKTGTEQLFSDEPTDCYQSVAFSPDGARLIGTHDQTVTVWDVESQQVVYETSGGESESIMVLALAPSGVAIAYGGRIPWLGGGGSTLSVWVPPSDPISYDMGENTAIHALAFSADGTVLAEGGGDFYLGTNSRLRLWDMRSQTPLITLHDHRHTVNSVVFSSDGTLLITGGEDGTIRLWGIPQESRDS